MSAPTGWPEAERAAREAYGRLVAWLAWQWRDIAAAEDAMASALLAALECWPHEGVPSNPDAWLLTTARRELLQAARRSRLATSPEVQALFEAEPEAGSAPALPDRRLELLCACAHPGLDAALHAPLMLQVVLGLQAQAIARAWLVPPATMAQRLVRAKARIREAGLRFDTAEAAELPARIPAVLEAIYGAYTIGSDPAAVAPEAESGLCDEAIFLARLVAAAVQGTPAAAEALGLLALLLFVESRRAARFDEHGAFVPLPLQDPARWQRPLIEEAEALLWQAAGHRAPGPLQLEAAIQSAHAQRLRSGHTPWAGIAQLYEALLQHHGGSLGARVAHAVALAEAGEVQAGLQHLAAIDATRVRDHQPYWVALAHLQRMAGLDAQAALQRAIGLTADERVRAFLLRGHSAVE
jgi:RNA polymerase sigma-70 factor (ECF subfamily)